MTDARGVWAKAVADAEEAVRDSGVYIYDVDAEDRARAAADAAIAAFLAALHEHGWTVAKLEQVGYYHAAGMNVSHEQWDADLPAVFRVVDRAEQGDQ